MVVPSLVLLEGSITGGLQAAVSTVFTLFQFISLPSPHPLFFKLSSFLLLVQQKGTWHLSWEKTANIVR